MPWVIVYAVCYCSCHVLLYMPCAIIYVMCYCMSAANSTVYHSCYFVLLSTLQVNVFPCLNVCAALLESVYVEENRRVRWRKLFLCGNSPKADHVLCVKCVESDPNTKLHSKSPKKFANVTAECKPIIH